MQSKGGKKASTEFRVGAKELEARGCRAEMQLVPCEGKLANLYSILVVRVSRYRLEVSIRSLELDARHLFMRRGALTPVTRCTVCLFLAKVSFL